MGSTYSRSFGWSLVGHLAAALLLSLFGFLRGFSCRRAPREMALPIEFLVESPASDPAPPEPAPPEPPEPAPPDPPSPQPPPPEPPPPDPPPSPDPPPVAERPRPPRPPIRVSTNLVRRPAPQRPAAARPTPPAAPRLTPEQVAEMLALGARPADRTVLAGEDERALAAIRDALYTAWIRPSAADRSSRPVLIEIRLDRFGNVTGRSISQRSGSPVLDDSALRAAQAVRQIRNIPPGFSDRYPSVLVRFELE